jgi:hypothetical protein
MEFRHSNSRILSHSVYIALKLKYLVPIYRKLYIFCTILYYLAPTSCSYAGTVQGRRKSKNAIALPTAVRPLSAFSHPEIASRKSAPRFDCHKDKPLQKWTPPIRDRKLGSDKKYYCDEQPQSGRANLLS